MHVGVNQVLLRSKGKHKGERLAPSSPCGVACGQVSALRSVDLSTASRLRRADTPICKEEIPKRKPITITVLSRALPPSYGSTYLSGKAVQTNRATSLVHTQAVIMHIQAGSSHLVALSNLFRTAGRFVVPMKNFKRHNFLGNIQRLKADEMIDWDEIHFYVRNFAGNPHILIVSKEQLDLEPLDSYQRLIAAMA